MQLVNSGTAYKGMIEGTVKIASGEGILKLWRGMSSVVVGAGMFLALLGDVPMIQNCPQLTCNLF